MTRSIANQPNPVDKTLRFKSIFNSLLPLLQSAGKDETIKQIELLFSRIVSNNVTVLICGEFKRGKSSLVNALIGEELCPVDDCIATSTVSLIRYGTKSTATRHYLDTSNKTVSETIDMSQLARFSKGSSINIDNTLLLEIEIPNEKLRSGLCVIDTPGIGGLDARHLSLTSFALTKADCVLFIADAGEPISASELDFIKDKIVPFGRSLKIVLNKIDTLSNAQLSSMLKDIQQKIDNRCNSLQVEIIPTSMYQWQLYNLTGDESYRIASNMDGLEKGLNDIRLSFKESLFPLLKTRLLQASDEIKKVFQSQLKAISDPSPDSIAKLQEQGKIIAQAKKEIEQSNSKFNRDLSAIMDEAQNEIMKQFSSDTIILSSSKLEELLNSNETKTADGIKYVSENLNEALMSLCGQLDNVIDASFEKVMEKAQISFKEEKFEFNSYLPSDIRLKEKETSEKLFSAARNSMSGLGIFSATSLIGGALVSQAVIMPIAAIGGIYMAYKSVVNASQTNIKTEIRRQIQPRLTIAINELRAYVQKRFKNFSNRLKEMLLGRAAEMETEITSIRLKLEECSTNMQRIAHQRSELQKRIAFIDSLSNQLKALLNNPFKIA